MLCIRPVNPRGYFTPSVPDAFAAFLVVAGLSMRTMATRLRGVRLGGVQASGKKWKSRDLRHGTWTVAEVLKG